MKNTFFLLLTFLSFSGCQQNKNEQQSDPVESAPQQITQRRNDSIKQVELIQHENDSIEKAEKQIEINERKSRTYKARPFAQMLLSFYMKNEVKADAKFQGQVYYVTGEIADISKNMDGNIYFNIGMGHPYQNIQCFVDDVSEIENAEIGQNVTAKGAFQSIFAAGQVNLNVRMEHCKILAE